MGEVVARQAIGGGADPWAEISSRTRGTVIPSATKSTNETAAIEPVTLAFASEPMLPRRDPPSLPGRRVAPSSRLVMAIRLTPRTTLAPP